MEKTKLHSHDKNLIKTSEYVYNLYWPELGTILSHYDAVFMKL